MCLHCPIKIGKCRAGFDVGALRTVLNPHILDVGQIDRDSVVAYRVPGDVVATAANCDVKSIFACKSDCMWDIIGIGALHDHSWPAINHGVPCLASLAVPSVLRTHYGALHGTFQFLNVLVESRCH